MAQQEHPAPQGGAGAQEHAGSQQGSVARNRTVIALALLCAAVLIVVLLLKTVSFSVHSSTANNVVTFGTVSIGVVETAVDASGDEVLVPDAPEQASESDPSSRIVRVRNYGDEPAYVRVRLDAAAEDESGARYAVDDLTSYGFSDERWIARDGWYYYGEILAPGCATGALITSVRFDVPAVHELVGNGLIYLDICAQGVQSDNNGASALDAEGWPEEGGR